MKILRKLTVLSVILSLLFTLWSPAAVFAAEPVTSPAVAVADPAPILSRDDPLYAGRELLAPLENGATLCYVYDRIIEAIVNGLEYVEFGAGCILTPEEQATLSSIINAIVPEGYGDNVGHSYGTVTENYFYSWFYDWGLDATRTAATDQQVKELTADMAGKSDFDKSRILYERLVEQNTYDFGDYHQTAYGALCEGMSVCAGYARAYQLLLQEVGIPCLYIPGVADNGYEVGGHAWNLVQLDGQWYYSDATWDDSDDSYFPLFYSYFNITYDEISVDHTADAEYQPWLPHSTAVEANYYYHEGTVCDTLTVEQFADLIKKQNPLFLYVTGDREALANFFFQNAYDIVYAMGFTNIVSAYYMPAGNHGLFLSLTLPHEHTYSAVTVAPTCAATGYTRYTCDECGLCYDDDFTAPLGHDVTGWWQDANAHAHVCNRCGDTADYGEHTYDHNGKSCDTCGYAAVTVLIGDTDGNGKVTNRDLGLLQQYINEWSVTIDVIAADLNGDGRINNRDLGQLQRLLNE